MNKFGKNLQELLCCSPNTYQNMGEIQIASLGETKVIIKL